MFPDPCGAALELAVANGADPAAVVPDEYFVVRGGNGPMPPAGAIVSCAVAPTLTAAAAAVPHGTIRASTVAAVRAAGGTVVWDVEVSRHLTINRQHVNITEVGPTTFSDLRPNPVPRRQRIDGHIP